jgi:hypothetical protein
MKLDDLEQKPPNEPNFGLVVVLFCLTIFAVFVLALLFVHFHGHHIHFLHPPPNPNAQLILHLSATAA